MRFAQFTAAAVLALGSLATTAVSAPQVLMVVTPTDVLPMACENGKCSTEVAAICLQPDRANPTRGENYSVFERTAQIEGAKSSSVPDTMSLVGIAADGSQTALPTWRHLRIQAERDHFAVKLSVDQSVLKQYGVVSLAVRVTGNMLLFPDAVEQDPNPQTDADLQVAKTTLRGVAERVLEQRADTLVGASVVRTAINTLPRDRATTEQERRRAQQVALNRTVSPKARSLAGEAFTACRNVNDLAVNDRYDSRYGYRHCLGIMHDGLVDGVNKQYWDALKAGS